MKVRCGVFGTCTAFCDATGSHNCPSGPAPANLPGTCKQFDPPKQSGAGTCAYNY